MKRVLSLPYSLILTAAILISLPNTLFIRADADPVPASISGDSTTNTIEWNEFYHSSVQDFQPGNVYRISFDYKITAQNDNTNFYVLVQDTDRPARKFAWDEWRGTSNVSSGSSTTSFTPEDNDKYILIFGIQHQGAITISNVQITSTVTVKPPVVFMPSPTRTWTSPGNSTYYIDSSNGSDTADGHSAATAWKSLDKVNTGTFAPGDHILLRAGREWTGYLAPGGSGNASSPIVIDRYGDGARPKIDAQEAWLTTVLITNSSYVTVRNLEIINKGSFPIPSLTGVKVSARDCGDVHSIVLDSLYVHDVNGSDVKDDGGGAGIDCSCGGSQIPTRFDGLTIENCHLVHTDRNGITMGGNWSRGSWYPSLHVVIQHNILEDIGGDGIVPIACDGCLVQYNVLRGGRTRCLDYAAGIWPWSCDNTTVQFNEVSGMIGTNDGEGYDCDYNCRNTLMQYNYSHDNDGGFMLICDDGSQSMPNNIGNIGSVVRYNVSVNDGLHTFHISGPCTNTNVYNNTIYLGPKSASILVASDSWGGLQVTTNFANNVFLAMHKVGFSDDGAQAFTFQNNARYGDLENFPSDPNAITSDPKLRAPGGDAPADYRPKPGSPLFNAGTPITNNGGRDYAANPVPTDTPPTIGAFEK